MLTLVIHDQQLADRIDKALEGYEPYDNGQMYINDREDGTFELYIGYESINDVVADIEE